MRLEDQKNTKMILVIASDERNHRFILGLFFKSVSITPLNKKTTTNVTTKIATNMMIGMKHYSFFKSIAEKSTSINVASIKP
ncbi:hypothetical protein CHH77_05705 [Shouchella clausii]|nr:hypothetical protein CHH77_05705 [Shouchella clausii]